MQHQKQFNACECTGKITYHNCDELTVRGQINNNVNGGRILYKAANPIDKRSSMSGSGLPFANAAQAFENSPNIEEVELSLNNTFSIDLLMPNSYYIGLGTVLIEPSLFIEYHDGREKQTVTVKLNNPIPYKSLTYPISTTHASRSSCLFYDGILNLPSRSQEQILYDSAYPFSSNPINNTHPENFWGTKPPC